MASDHAKTLRMRSLRATPGRIELLGTLEAAHAPRSAEELHEGASVDLATIYRNLQALAEAGLVNEVRFNDGIVRYEYGEGGHHHHLVCTGCGIIDELPECDVAAMEKDVLGKSKRFVSIQEHALEFFGMCNACARE